MNMSSKSKHGMRGTPTYSSWVNMRNRCKYECSPSYKDYGARGIRVCEEWNDFSNFLQDMGERPPGTSIDRIDVNGNYCKENCRWANKRLQNLNTKKRVNGVTSKHIGVSYCKIMKRWRTSMGLGRGVPQWRRYFGTEAEAIKARDEIYKIEFAKEEEECERATKLRELERLSK